MFTQSYHAPFPVGNKLDDVRIGKARRNWYSFRYNCMIVYILLILTVGIGAGIGAGIAIGFEIWGHENKCSHDGISGVVSGAGTLHHDGTSGVVSGSGTSHHDGTSGVVSGSGTSHYDGTSGVVSGSGTSHHDGTSGVVSGSGTSHHDGTCPPAFANPLTAPAALANCSADYVSFEQSNKTLKTCLQYLDGKGVITEDNPVAQIWWGEAQFHPAQIIFRMTLGSWVILKTLGCPINLVLLSWVHGLYRSIYTPPLACSADVEATLLLHSQVYDWELLFGIDPSTPTGAERYKYTWIKTGFRFSDMDPGLAVPMPTNAPTLLQLKGYLEKVTQGIGLNPYSSKNAIFQYAINAITSLHLTMLVQQMIRSVRRDANDTQKTWSINITYNGPSTPPCNGSLGYKPGFEHGSNITLHGYEDPNELTPAQHATSLETFTQAQFTCGTVTTDEGNVAVPSYMDLYEDVFAKMYMGYMKLEASTTTAYFRTDAAVNVATSRMFWPLTA